MIAPLALALLLVAGPAAAAPLPWFGVTGGAGWVAPDGDLADYGRDVRPGGALGLEGRAGLGPWTLGLRGVTGARPQDLGPIGAGGTSLSTDARTTRLELVGRRQVARLAGQTLALAASAGRARVSFDPGSVVIDDGSGGTLDVTLAPVSAWTVGGGVAIERALGPTWTAGVEADASRLAMDTAHRVGDEIVTERTAFTDWSVRVTLGWNTPH